MPVFAETPSGRRLSRDWAIDMVWFLAAACFTALAYGDNASRGIGAATLVLDATLGGVSCLAMWLRRRWPVGIAVTIIGLSIFSTAASGVALIALFGVAARRRLAVVAQVTAGFAAASIVGALVWSGPSPSVPQAALGAVCVAAAVAWGMFIRARRQLAQTQRERARRGEADRVAQARRHERHRIAREMHDVLAHRISLVSLHAGALELCAQRPPEEIVRAAGVIRDNAHQALEDLREVIGVLRADRAGDDMDDAPDRPQPTLVDLPDLVGESTKAETPVRLDFRVADPATVPVAVGRSAYRIVQEGLTNGRKHARGAEVSVAVSGARGDGLTIEIRNPCPVETSDIPPIPGSGSGLIGLTERVGLAGGRMECGRTSHDDFRLWVWLPWPT